MLVTLLVIYEAFISTGLTPAPDHKRLPRTIFDGSKNTNFFDQVAWFEAIHKKPFLSLKYRTGGNFDFPGVTMPELMIQQLPYRISDHFPLWVELGR